MAIIQMPMDLLIASASVGRMHFEIEEVSEVTGSVAARVMGPPRWVYTLGAPDYMSSEQNAKWEAMVLGLRGRLNHLAVWDPGRIAPKGTLRGSLVTLTPLLRGDTSISISGGAGQAGRTLVPGDWLQIGSGVGSSQNVKVIVGGTADGSGSITVTFESPLRRDYPGGTPVWWDRALTYCRSSVRDSISWKHVAGAPDLHGGFQISVIESWG